jgi:heterotetrameric sarcosine oxidase delta subunit
MRITCPYCGERGHDEFTYLGDATVKRPSVEDIAPAGPDLLKQWGDYVYLRDNPAGLHRELWQHVSGCRAWLVLTRHLRTHQIEAVELARVVAEKAEA